MRGAVGAVRGVAGRREVGTQSPRRGATMAKRGPRWSPAHPFAVLITAVKVPCPGDAWVVRCHLSVHTYTCVHCTLPVVTSPSTTALGGCSGR